MKKILLYLTVITIFSSSCSPSLTPFTERIQDQYNFTESELKRIQFYLSDDIVLRRELSGSASEIVSGEIKLIDGRKVEEIRILKGTPGVLMFAPKSDRMAVSFEEGSDKRYLMFGPNPKASGRYVLLAKDWNRRAGAVTYEGQLYKVDGASAYASLMVDLKKVNKVDVNRRTASGRTVNN